MKLQEQINRIQSMMGTLNENKLEADIEELGIDFVIRSAGIEQILKRLKTTSKKLQIVQNFINGRIDDLKKICETMNADSEEIISFDACELLESLNSVQVTNINPTNKAFIVQIIIKYESIFAAMYEDGFISELQWELKKYIPNIKLQVEDSINTKDRQW
jgi:NAD dependent epimerase/dehydratase family enzyme